MYVNCSYVPHGYDPAILYGLNSRQTHISTDANYYANKREPCRWRPHVLFQGRRHLTWRTLCNTCTRRTISAHTVRWTIHTAIRYRRRLRPAAHSLDTGKSPSCGVLNMICALAAAEPEPFHMRRTMYNLSHSNKQDAQLYVLTINVSPNVHDLHFENLTLVTPNVWPNIYTRVWYYVRYVIRSIPASLFFF